MSWMTELSGADRFFVEVSVKAAVVLGLGWAASQALRWCRSSAATRHAVWTAALLGAVALPVLTCTLPPLGIAMEGIAPLAAPLVAPPAPASSPARLALDPVRPAPAAGAGVGGDSATGTPATAASTGKAVVTSGNGPASAGVSWLAALWLAGSMLALSPLVLGLARLRRVGRTAPSVTAGPLHDALAAAAARLGIRRSIRLLESPAQSMPMTWGLFRPAVLLPAEARSWPAGRLAAVLLHELAHIQRRDCWIQALSQLARAMHWFNPLSWLGERQLRILQEQACDDRVLAGGIEAADYAEHLLAVSARCRRGACLAGLAMSRAAKLERRLGSILSSRGSRRPLTRRRLALVVLAGITLVPPISMASLELSAADGETRQAPADASGAGAAPDLAQALSELRARIAEQYVGPVDDMEIVQHAIKGMLGALRDPHADYLTPAMLAEMERQVSGTLIGIGVQLDWRDGQISVVTPLPGSPALKAGLKSNDVILQVDGAPVAGMPLRDVVQRILGPEGTSLRLLIGREPDQELDVEIVRASITLESVKGVRRGDDHRWDYLLDAGHRIGLVQITHLGGATAGEVKEAVEGLKAGGGLNGLILDLRSCPGGLLESAVAVSSLFLAQGTIVSMHGRSGEPVVISADGSGTLVDVPLVVLVNGQTASAAEIIAGALQDHRRALVVGTRTFGKGSVQTLIKLTGASGAIRLTTARYRLPGGRNIDRRDADGAWGIDPDAGYFIALDRDQSLQLTERRQASDAAGAGARPLARGPALGPSRLAGEDADPQLSAATGALVERIETGAFAPGRGWSPAEIERFLKREELEQRRDALTRDLERLDRELSDLGAPPPARR